MLECRGNKLDADAHYATRGTKLDLEGDGRFFFGKEIEVSVAKNDLIVKDVKRFRIFETAAETALRQRIEKIILHDNFDGLDAFPSEMYKRFETQKAYAESIRCQVYVRDWSPGKILERMPVNHAHNGFVKYFPFPISPAFGQGVAPTKQMYQEALADLNRLEKEWLREFEERAGPREPSRPKSFASSKDNFRSRTMKVDYVAAAEIRSHLGKV